MKVLVAGVGNVFRRDDGFGSEVARALATASLPAGVRVVDYGIRGMHLAYELLDCWDALVIIDTVPRHGAAGDLVVLEVTARDLGTGEFDAHGMAPTAVLATLDTLGGTLPRTFVVGCEPADTGDGIGLTAPVADAVDRAATLAADLVGRLAAGVTTAAAGTTAPVTTATGESP